jgi:hypothetical protein
MPWKYNVTAQSKERELAYFFQEICTRVKFGSFTWNPDPVLASTMLSTTITAATSVQLTGLRVGMAISVTPPATFPAGLAMTAFVGTDDSLTILLSNYTAGNIDIASATWSFMGIVIS